MGVLVRAEIQRNDRGTKMSIVTKATVERMKEAGFPIAHALVPLIPALDKRGDSADARVDTSDLVVLFLRGE